MKPPTLCCGISHAALPLDWFSRSRFLFWRWRTWFQVWLMRIGSKATPRGSPNSSSACPLFFGAARHCGKPASNRSADSRRTCSRSFSSESARRGFSVSLPFFPTTPRPASISNPQPSSRSSSSSAKSSNSAPATKRRGPSNPSSPSPQKPRASWRATRSAISPSPRSSPATCSACGPARKSPWTESSPKAPPRSTNPCSLARFCRLKKPLATESPAARSIPLAHFSCAPNTPAPRPFSPASSRSSPSRNAAARPSKTSRTKSPPGSFPPCSPSRPSLFSQGFSSTKTSRSPTPFRF